MPLFDVKCLGNDIRYTLRCYRPLIDSDVLPTELCHYLMLSESADLAQNRPVWRMMSTYGATQS